ncbi:hypothetical protein BVRB_1g017810 [Beta vulgaris subsp. vulgaris]|nr:hypothetical protein BVRB_1g017810 [Beta vulgaris subsp. vulgaris]
MLSIMYYGFTATLIFIWSFSCSGINARISFVRDIFNVFSCSST